jgi:hypothetical protein
MTSKNYKEMVKKINEETAERTAVEEAVAEVIEWEAGDTRPEGASPAGWYFIDAERDEEDEHLWHATAFGKRHFDVRTEKASVWRAKATKSPEDIPPLYSMDCLGAVDRIPSDRPFTLDEVGFTEAELIAIAADSEAELWKLAGKEASCIYDPWGLFNIEPEEEEPQEPQEPKNYFVEYDGEIEGIPTNNLFTLEEVGLTERQLWELVRSYGTEAYRVEEYGNIQL